jgi:hypothetical protein
MLPISCGRRNCASFSVVITDRGKFVVFFFYDRTTSPVLSQRSDLGVPLKTTESFEFSRVQGGLSRIIELAKCQFLTRLEGDASVIRVEN